MTYEEFVKLNPIIVGDKYRTTSRLAYLQQGEFLKNHKFIFKNMDERMVAIIKLRCGMIDGKVWKLEDIGERLCLSHERVRQIESKAFIKLSHPYRIRLMMQYTDDTYDTANSQLVVEDFTSLIKQDIINHIDLKSMADIESLEVEHLQIVLKGPTKQTIADIQQKFKDNNIVTCADLIAHIQANGGLEDIGIGVLAYRAVIYAICELIDSKNANINARKIFQVHNDHKRECAEIAEKVKREEEIRIRKLADLQKVQRLQEASIHPENVLIEDLGFHGRILNGLKTLNFKTLKDIIDYYYANGLTIYKGGHIGPIGEKAIIAKLKELNIDLVPDLEQKLQQCITDPNSLYIEQMDFCARTTNCLKRNRIHTVGQLIDFYVTHNASFKAMRNLGDVCEREILNKLAEYGIDIKGDTNSDNLIK